jgi:transposase
VLGASNYTYAEARWSEGLADWIGAHVNALNMIGGVPKAVVCDNLKAGVTAACRYEPGINRTYQELAEHYDTAILPARPRKPRDKAKVEVAVQIVQRFVLARLRNRRFFSLQELNAAIRETVADLNAKIMRKLGVSRDELFAEIDRPALKALPTTPYQFAEWKKCRVAPDYHVEIADHYYSVPSRLIREQLEARITDSTIEILHKGARVASHVRSHVRRRHTTIPDHMPSAHRRYAEWTPARMMREAAKIGPATIALVAAIMKAKPHPEQASAPVWASCGSPAVTARHASRPPAAAAMTSAPPPTARSNRSCSMGSIVPTPMTSQPTGHPSNTAISAALATTTEERSDDVDTSHPRPPRHARAHRHGEGARRTATTT